MTVETAMHPSAGAKPGQKPRHVRVAIIGGGLSGVGAAMRLKRAGISDFIVLERAEDLGGTWRDNHYPGCCCDIPSHVYSYSFELEPAWTRGFAPQPEILAYLKRTASRHGVLDHVEYGHQVVEAAWDVSQARWAITTTRGCLEADIMIVATGPLSDPKAPDIPGLDTFKGTVFHSARWNHEHALDGERVAVIGTGASAIQFVPKIQPAVSRLHVFQRTPPWIVPRFDHRITEVEHKLLKAIPFAPALTRAVLWGLLEARVVAFRNPKLMRLAEKVATAHMRHQVKDAALRRKLTPDYTIGCKRILVSDDYYPALVQPNVEVVTSGVAEVREHSVVSTDGVERPIDTIIFGTGFHVTDAPIATHIRGRDGRTLAEAWTPSMRAYLGISVAGFPNMFYMLGPNTGLGHNSMIYMIESQLNYISTCLHLMDRRGIDIVEVRQETQDAYNTWLDGMLEGTVWTAGNCQSWYLDASGRNSTLWPTWTFAYRRRTRRFRGASYLLKRYRPPVMSPDNGLIAGPGGPAVEIRQESPAPASLDVSLSG